MSKQDNAEVRAVEDAAWDIKDCAADLFGRPLSDADKAALGSVQRDLARLLERLAEVRDRRRRKRGATASDAAPEEQPEPPEPAHANVTAQ